MLTALIKKFFWHCFTLKSDNNLTCLWTNKLPTPSEFFLWSTMAAELLLCLSRDLLKLFESSTVYDVSITVGEASNTKTFKAHSAILISRSPYFAAALSTNLIKKENNISIFRKPNITPKVFDILLK